MDTATLNQDRSISRESLVPVDDRGVVEGAAQPSTDEVRRSIVGDDDRTQVGDASGYPTRVVGWLWTKNKFDDWSACTGTLIGPRTVLTAAHCVYDPDFGWAQDLLFVPGATDPQNAPFGKIGWSKAHVPVGFIEHYDGSTYASVARWDVGTIELNQPVGNELGWLGYRVDDGSPFSATELSYPGDEQDGSMWVSKCDVPRNATSDVLLLHACDTYSGSSGSALWEAPRARAPLIRAVDVAEDEEGNIAVRLTRPYFNFVRQNDPPD